MCSPGQYLGQHCSQHAVPSSQEEWIPETPRSQHHLIEHNLYINIQELLSDKVACGLKSNGSRTMEIPNAIHIIMLSHAGSLSD